MSEPSTREQEKCKACPIHGEINPPVYGSDGNVCCPWCRPPLQQEENRGTSKCPECGYDEPHSSHLHNFIAAIRARLDEQTARAEQAEQQLAAMTRERDELRLRRQETINMAVQLEMDIEQLKGQLTASEERVMELEEKQGHEITMLQMQLTEAQALKNTLYKERNQLRAMLDRIDAIPEVADGYHAPAEENIADGVEALVENYREAKTTIVQQLAAMTQELERERELHAWEYTPAMAEARMNQLVQQLAALKQARERESWHEQRTVLERKIDQLHGYLTEARDTKNTLYKERNQLRAMLDRIDAIPEVADGYHAPNEESIADGVESVVDNYREAQNTIARLEREETESACLSGQLDQLQAVVSQQQDELTKVIALKEEIARLEQILSIDLKNNNAYREKVAQLQATNARLNAQIKQLASWIIEHVPGEPSCSDGACATSERIMERLQATVTAQAEEMGRLRDELSNIATANTSQWDDPTDFKVWAQNRAQFALASGKDIQR